MLIHIFRTASESKPSKLLNLAARKLIDIHMESDSIIISGFFAIV